MKKYLVWTDGHKHELSPLTFEEFDKLGLWAGASDIAYASWLRYHNFHELDSFNEEALEESFLAVELGDTPLYFSIEDGEDKYQPYEELKETVLQNHQLQMKRKKYTPVSYDEYVRITSKKDKSLTGE